jgi:hypothetical protein
VKRNLEAAAKLKEEEAKRETPRINLLDRPSTMGTFYRKSAFGRAFNTNDLSGSTGDRPLEIL